MASSKIPSRGEAGAPANKRTSQSPDLRRLIDFAPALIHTGLPDGYLDFFNQGWLDYLGRPLEDLQGWKWTAVIHPDDVEGIVQKWRASLASGEPFLHETRVRRADGEYRWMLHHKVAVRDEHGNIVKWHGSSIDIEDRKRAEDALRKREKELRAVLDSIPAIVWSTLPDGSNTYVNKRFVEYSGSSPEQTAGSRWQALIHPDDRERHASKWTEAVATGKPLENEVRSRRSDGQYRWQLDRGVPLRDEDGNIVKWYGVTTDIEDRKRAEEALQQSEFYLAEGQRLAHMGSWAFKATGFSYWSPELFQVHGLDPRGKPPTVTEYLALVHPEDRAFMKQGITQMLVDHRAFDFTKRIVRPDGEIRSVRCVGVPVTQGGTFQGFLGTGMDVTEQERLTQELQRREAYLAEAQRLSHTGSFGWKPDSGEIVWSDETYRIFQHDPTVELTIDAIAQRVHPEDRTEFLEVINHASAGATQFEHTYRLLLPDGRIKHVHALAHALEDASGNREFVGAGIDVTSIKRAEEELRRSEAYLAEAQRLSKTGSWAWSPDHDIRYWSEECYRVLSFDPQDGLPRFEDFFQRIHPDDQPGFRELIQTAIREKAEWEADYRIVHLDGPVRDIHVVGHPVLSTSGHLVEFVGTVIDVTERKRAEEELRRSEMELRQMLDLTPQQVGVFAPDGSTLWVNRAALEYFGIDIDQWRAASRVHFCHPDDREHFLSEREKGFLEGAPFELEARLLRHDGKFRWFLMRLNPLKDESGNIKRWYGGATDIEERKQAEESLRNENIALREEISKASMFEEIVCASPALRMVLSRISKVAPTASTVLITGETGTGKELIARAIHRRSQCCSRPFVSVNCAAIPRDLIASELFGHEKGAFTGALQRRLGKFELAEGGTIFLDEIGELPAETQIALLRVLQEREFERVGSARSIRIDVRVIAATNRDLQAAIAAGVFRTDLFYRLNVFPLQVPPLRDRKDDIPMLVEYFIDRFARQSGKKITSIDKKTLELVQAYPWPGNIRELQNVIERSVVLAETDTFFVDESWLSPASPSLQSSNTMLSKRPALQEKEIIEAALAETKGRVSGPAGAAAKLGVPSTTLESKIKSLKINKHQFKTT